MTTTIEQKRAKNAWEAIDKIEAYNGPEANAAKDDYATEARKMPVRILNSGLGQALAFIAAKAKENDPQLERPGLVILIKHLEGWIKDRLPKGECETQPKLIERIIDSNAIFLRRATDETLAWLVWLNRFADARDIKPQNDVGGRP